MNSGGIGMLVTLLVRSQRRQQRLAAVGLSDHYRQIFELTRLDEAIALHDDRPTLWPGLGDRGEEDVDETEHGGRRAARCGQLGAPRWTDCR